MLLQRKNTRENFGNLHAEKLRRFRQLQKH